MANYKIAEDIKLTCELLGYGVRELAADCGISYPTLNRWLKGAERIQPARLETLYAFAFSQGIRLNKIKEQLYTEDMPDGCKLLFHGAKTELVAPLDLVHSRPFNDFGTGLYCGETLEQAALFVAHRPASSVYALSLKSEGLNEARFDVDTEWMLAVSYYRGRLGEFAESEVIREIAASVEAADYIVAPIADNRIFELIDSFAFGEMTDVQCAHCLSATHLGSQYVLRTEAALGQSRILERCYLAQPEREVYAGLAAEHGRVARDKTKLARRAYRGEGRYIDELLGEG